MDRVLLSVEDNDSDFFVIQMALKQANIAVHLCRVNDGEEAVAFLQKSGGFAGSPRPDLVLSNVNMPRKDGFEVLEYMKGQELLRSIPVVLFTTSANTADRGRALALGAEDFITKPSTLAGLISVLRGVCNRFLRDRSARAH